MITNYMELSPYINAIKAVEKLAANGQTVPQMHGVILSAVEAELMHPEIYGDYVVVHYEPEVEAILDADNDIDEVIENRLDEIIKHANDEIGLFTRYGHNYKAGQIKQSLNELLEICAN